MASEEERRSKLLNDYCELRRTHPELPAQLRDFQVKANVAEKLGKGTGYLAKKAGYTKLEDAITTNTGTKIAAGVAAVILVQIAAF